MQSDGIFLFRPGIFMQLFKAPSLKGPHLSQDQKRATCVRGCRISHNLYITFSLISEDLLGGGIWLVFPLPVFRVVPRLYKVNCVRVISGETPNCAKGSASYTCPITGRRIYPSDDRSWR